MGRFLFMMLLFAGLVAGLYLVGENQNLARKAVAPSGGAGKIVVVPALVTHYPGETFSTQIKLNTGGYPISSVAMRLTYPYTGTTPELDVVDQNGNPANVIYPETSVGSFPINSVTRSGSKVTIDLAVVNLSTTGFMTSVDTTAATIYFKVNRAVTANPLTLTFETALSQMMTKADPPVDILNPPVNPVYTIQNDTTAPSAITDLAAANPTQNSAVLSWTAPADVGPTGKAASYDLRYSPAGITEVNWAGATQITGEPVPSAPGGKETFTVTGLNGGTQYFLAIKSADSAANVSPISNVASVVTASPTLTVGLRMQGVSAAAITRPVDIFISNGINSQSYTGVSFLTDSSGVFKNGSATTLTGLPVAQAGTAYDVYASTAGYLRRKLGNMTFIPGANTVPSAWTATPLKAGDFNRDNILNIADIGLMLSKYTALSVPVDSTNQVYDIDASGSITVTDIAIVLANYTALSVPGD
jgi:hypothetical protein